MDPAVFVRRNTAITAPPLVPEIRLHLATEVTPIWQATEKSLARSSLPPPFWAFAWAGGQALARYLLDHPEQVDGRSVLDFGAGSGLVAIAAAKAGAAFVLAAEIDHFAAAAIAANSALNGVNVAVTMADLIDTTDPRWEVITAGDVCYELPMADRVIGWLRTRARSGSLVLLGDPGRAYLPAESICAPATSCPPVATLRIAIPATGSYGRCFRVKSRWLSCARQAVPPNPYTAACHTPACATLSTGSKRAGG